MKDQCNADLSQFIRKRTTPPFTCCPDKTVVFSLTRGGCCSLLLLFSYSAISPHLTASSLTFLFVSSGPCNRPAPLSIVDQPSRGRSNTLNDNLSVTSTSSHRLIRDRLRLFIVVIKALEHCQAVSTRTPQDS